jgi:hypothetical protein
MGTTANRLYPYPDPGDPADMPQRLQDLAEAVDLDVQALVTSLTPVSFAVVSSESTQFVFPGFPIPIVYDAVNYDNAGLADLANYSDRLTMTTGIWFVHFSARFEDVTDMVEAFLRLGGVTDYGRVIHQGNSPGQPRLAISALINITGTQFVRGTIEHNGSTSLSVSTARLVARKLS